MGLPPSPFLTAQWLHLAMLNFEIAPAVVRPYVPAGTELCTFGQKTFVSIVGFLFRDTRVLGMSIPFHRNFEEVNLRFYVRRKADGGWRRAVVFIKELAPRRAVGWTARVFYGENYRTVPMGHRIEIPNGEPNALRAVSYWWTLDGRENRIEVTVAGTARAPLEGSQEEFITEHYWGYSGGANRRTIEYRVDHPRWKIWPARQSRLACDVARCYGDAFVEALSARPASAFLADGSPVTVHRGVKIAR